jgi:hypothetical protein
MQTFDISPSVICGDVIFTRRSAGPCEALHIANRHIPSKLPAHADLPTNDF